MIADDFRDIRRRLEDGLDVVPPPVEGLPLASAECRRGGCYWWRIGQDRCVTAGCCTQPDLRLLGQTSS